MDDSAGLEVPQVKEEEEKDDEQKIEDDVSYFMYTFRTTDELTALTPTPAPQQQGQQGFSSSSATPYYYRRYRPPLVCYQGSATKRVSFADLSKLFLWHHRLGHETPSSTSTSSPQHLSSSTGASAGGEGEKQNEEVREEGSARAGPAPPPAPASSTSTSERRLPLSVLAEMVSYLPTIPCRCSRREQGCPLGQGVRLSEQNIALPESLCEAEAMLRSKVQADTFNTERITKAFVSSEKFRTHARLFIQTLPYQWSLKKVVIESEFLRTGNEDLYEELLEAIRQSPQIESFVKISSGWEQSDEKLLRIPHLEEFATPSGGLFSNPEFVSKLLGVDVKNPAELDRYLSSAAVPHREQQQRYAALRSLEIRMALTKPSEFAYHAGLLYKESLTSLTLAQGIADDESTGSGSGGGGSGSVGGSIPAKLRAIVGVFPHLRHFFFASDNLEPASFLRALLDIDRATGSAILQPPPPEAQGACPPLSPEQQRLVFASVLPRLQTLSFGSAYGSCRDPLNVPLLRLLVNPLIVSLSRLELIRCGLSCVVVISLAKLLDDEDTVPLLNWLDLSYNRIEYRGVKALVDCKRMAKLTTLKLHGNSIGMAARDLWQMYVSLPSMIELSVFPSDLDMSAIRQFVQLTRRRRETQQQKEEG